MREDGRKEGSNQGREGSKKVGKRSREGGVTEGTDSG